MSRPTGMTQKTKLSESPHNPSPPFTKLTKTNSPKICFFPFPLRSFTSNRHCIITSHCTHPLKSLLKSKRFKCKTRRHNCYYKCVKQIDMLRDTWTVGYNFQASKSYLTLFKPIFFISYLWNNCQKRYYICYDVSASSHKYTFRYENE